MELVISQTFLIESFVEDLLNLKLLNEGILELTYAQFSPLQAIDFVVDTMKIKAVELKIEMKRLIQAEQQFSDSAENFPDFLVGDERRFK